MIEGKKDENGNEIGEENKIPGLSAGYATNEAIEAFKKGSKVTKKLLEKNDITCFFKTFQEYYDVCQQVNKEKAGKFRYE